MKNLQVAFLVSLMFLSGCATAQFSRVRGTVHAELHDIRVYNSQPPAEFPYRSLGLISAEGYGSFTLARLDNALEKLTLIARNMGANAIINWKIVPKFGFSIEMEGEAVFFDQFPNVHND